MLAAGVLSRDASIPHTRVCVCVLVSHHVQACCRAAWTELLRSLSGWQHNRRQALAPLPTTAHRRSCRSLQVVVGD